MKITMENMDQHESKEKLDLDQLAAQERGLDHMDDDEDGWGDDEDETQ